LGQKAPLPPDIAKVYAAGLLADASAFQQGDRPLALTQKKCGSGTHEAAAYNHDI